MASYLIFSTVTRSRRRLAAALLAGLAAGVGSIGVPGLAPVASAFADGEKPGARTVRPEIGKPIQAAADLIKHKHGREALEKVREADAVPNKTPYEAYVIELTRGSAASTVGNASEAARAFETAANSPAASAGEKLQFLAGAANQYYSAKNYAKSAEVAARYFKDGGAEKAIRTLYVQALYLSNNYAAAAKEVLILIQTEEQAGKVPPEDQLQLLQSAYYKQHDTAGYANALEKLVTYYPKKDYWLDVIESVKSRSGFSERLSLDLARLKLATGTMRSANEYVEAAQLSLQAGLPAEAKKFIDQGYAAGVLGTGPEADRHRRLKDMAAKNLAEDKAALGQDDAKLAASNDGTALLSTGLDYVLNGNAHKGLEMMELGIRKGGLKRPDDARLQLGYAYQVAGQNQKAIQVFKTVHGTDGAASLARLWILHLGRGA